MIYIVILAYILILTYRYDYLKSKKNRMAAFYSIMVIFILLSGLRYNIGIDSIEYRRTWLWYPDFWDFNWAQDIEKFRDKGLAVQRFRPGWIMYVMSLQTISKDFTILQLCNAIIANIAIFSVIKKYSEHIFTTVLIFYGTSTFVEFEFELMREVIAVAIFLLWGFDAFVQKKWIKYYTAVIVAISFHPSAMMMLTLPFVRNLNWSTRQYIFYLIIPSIVLALAGRLFIGNALSMILGEEAYASEYFKNAKEGNFNYFLMYAYKPSILLALYLCFKRYVTTPRYFIPVFFFSIFFQYIGGLVYTAARFTSYIIIIDNILISGIFYKLIKRCRTIWIAVALLTIYYAPNIYNYTNPLALARHYPYRSIFNPEPTKEQALMEKAPR